MIRRYLNSFRAILMLAAVAFIANACTIAKISGRGSQPLMLNNPTAKVQVLSHFKESKMVTFDYTSAFDVSEILAEKLASSQADAVTNLSITVKTDAAAFCINLITLGLAQAKVFAVEGDLVKAPQGLGSLLDNSKILVEANNIEEIKQYLKKLDLEKDNVAAPTIIRTENGFAVIEQAK